MPVAFRELFVKFDEALDWAMHKDLTDDLRSHDTTIVQTVDDPTMYDDVIGSSKFHGEVDDDEF